MVRRRRPYVEPEPLSSVLPRLMREFGPRRTGVIDLLRRAWPAAVGEATAARARPAGWRDGVLTVRVSSAAVKHDLSTFRAEAVLRGLREAVPEANLRSIRYQVGG